jgi:hypothetical protein
MSEKKDNVIAFPNIRLDAPPQTQQEVSDKIASYRESYANDISAFLTTLVVTEMSRAGCDMSDEEHIVPSIILINQAIKSLHLLTSGMDHPLQEYAMNEYEGVELMTGYDEDDDDD